MLTIEYLKDLLIGLHINWNPKITIEEYSKIKTLVDTPFKFREMTPPKFDPQNYPESYTIFASKTINQSFLKKKTHSFPDQAYFIKKINDNRHFYISLGFSEPIFWMYFNSTERLRKNLEEIFLLYGDQDEDFHVQTYALIGSVKNIPDNILKFEENFIKSPYSESLLWGSAHDSYPFERNEIPHIPGHELMKRIHESMRQFENYYTISTRTMYSKSTIKIIFLNGYYMIHIMYRPPNYKHPSIPIINKNTGRSYSLDLPIDVIMALVDYPYIDYLSIIETYKPNYQFAFKILDQLVPNNDVFYIDKLISNITGYFHKEKDQELVNQLLKYHQKLNMIKEQVITNQKLQQEHLRETERKKREESRKSFRD